MLKDCVPLKAGEVIDAAFMNLEELCTFYEKEITEAKESEMLFSLVHGDQNYLSMSHPNFSSLPQHLKATVMKISDPIMFGHCVQVFFKDAFEKHSHLFEKINANANNGLGAVIESVTEKLGKDNSKKVLADIEACNEIVHGLQRLTEKELQT